VSGGVQAGARSAEPRFALPAGPFYLVVLGTAAAAAAVAAWAANHWAGDALAGAFGAAVAGATALLGAAILRPSKVREASDWMTAWLAATVVRLLATPLAAGSLYFALPEPGRAFLLSVAGTYLACLLAETLWLARSVHDALSRAATSRGASTPAGDHPSETT